MSVGNIRAALETAINGMSPSLSTAWENVAFTPPVATTAYQRVNILFAQPDHGEAGRNHIELGIVFINLMYPVQIGPSTAETRAELLRTTFYRGATFSSGGTNVIITDSPEVTRGEAEQGRYVLTVKIRFKSFIT